MTITEIPEGAKPPMPQGHTASVPIGNTKEGAEAVDPAPRGRTIGAGAPSTASDGEAVIVLPQGHGSPASAIGELCGEIMSLQRDRRFAIRMITRCENATLAYVRVRLGFRTDQTEAERKRITAQARALKNAIEGGAADLSDPITAAVRGVVVTNALSLGTWEESRRDIENRMRRLAAGLPAQGFVASTRGLSLLGLAVIVGEAGELSAYPKKGHLWKRMGLAVVDGARQGMVPREITGKDRAEAWKARAYSPQRRAEVFAFIDDVMLRQQIGGGEARGRYGVYYVRKKAEYLGREWKPKHADGAARRYMSKMLLRDLHRAWCDEVSAASPIPS